MPRLNFTLAILAVLLASATCSVLSRLGAIDTGECPDVPSQAVFNATRYLGRWYEYERFPAIFEPGFDCVSANYNVKPDGQIGVLNAGYLKLRIGGHVIFSKKFEAKGNATICNPDKPAELCVKFSSFQPASNRTNYKVVATDYTGYTLIYSCTEVFGFNYQFAWILTRKRGAQPANLDELRQKLASRGVDISNFRHVNQKDCDE